MRTRFASVLEFLSALGLLVALVALYLALFQ